MRSHPREKIGRNDPCPCGSGKKYKQCRLAKATFAFPGPETLDTPWSRQRDVVIQAYLKKAACSFKGRLGWTAHLRREPTVRVSSTKPSSNTGFETNTTKTSEIRPVVEPTNLWNSVSDSRRSIVCRTQSSQRRITPSFQKITQSLHTERRLYADALLVVA